MKKLVLSLFLVFLFFVILSGVYFLIFSKPEPFGVNVTELTKRLPQLTIPSFNRISFESKLIGYDIRFLNRDSLEKELEVSGFWKTNGVGINNDSTVMRTTAKKLNIVFTNQKQPFGGVYSSKTGQEKTSFDFKVDRGNASLVLGVNMDELENSSNPQGFINSALISSLFKVSFWESATVENSSYFKYLDSLTNRIDGGKVKYPFFSVSKK